MTGHRPTVPTDAHPTLGDVNTGAPTITWTITPSDEPGTHFGFRNVVTTPDAGTVTGIANEVDFPHANGDVITVKHELPAGFTGEVSISPPPRRRSRTTFRNCRRSPRTRSTSR